MNINNVVSYVVRDKNGMGRSNERTNYKNERIKMTDWTPLLIFAGIIVLNIIFIWALVRGNLKIVIKNRHKRNEKHIKKNNTQK